MKKIVSVLLLLSLMLCLCVGCDNTTRPEEEPPVVEESIQMDIETDKRLLVNASTDALEFGVVNDINLFEPEKDITFFVRTKDSSLAGDTVHVTLDNAPELTFTLEEGVHIYTGKFTKDLNGTYEFSLRTEQSRTELFFMIGVMPRVEQASDEFFYGAQAYLNRVFEWPDASLIPDTDRDTTLDVMIKTLQFMGVNAIRDDNPTWGVLQKSQNSKINFSEADAIVNLVTGNGLYYNVIFGYNGGKWTVKEELKDRYDDDSFRFAFCPDPEIWDTFAAAVADRYADNDKILWEIWNEPNWEFFVGEREDYFRLLESTASIIKTVNPNAFVYSGGLAVADRQDNLPYYLKAKELIDKGLLDSFGYHIHETLPLYYDAMSRILALINKSGMSDVPVMNSESGVYGADPVTIAVKALYTRATGGKGFMAYTLNSGSGWDESVNKYAMYNGHFCPKRAAISYGTVIRFLGQMHFDKKTVMNDLVSCDRYYNDDGTTLVLYLHQNTTAKKQVTLPAGFTLYDLYGNPVEDATATVSVTTSPVYAVYDRLLTDADFSS